MVILLILNFSSSDMYIVHRLNRKYLYREKDNITIPKSIELDLPHLIY